MQGYWRDLEATGLKLRPGHWPWERILATGDLFRADEEGYLYVEGRRDDQIKSRGEKVMPREVEDVLLSHDAVREAAVVGVPDRLLGQAIHAHVVLADGVEVKTPELRRHCAERLEVHKVPKQVVSATPCRGRSTASSTARRWRRRRTRASSKGRESPLGS